MTIRSTNWMVSAILLISAAGFAQVGPPTGLVVSWSFNISAQVGVFYSAALSAANGTPPYTYSILADPDLLPPGLNLNSSTGAITGTPTAAGTYHFIYQAVDSSSEVPSSAGPASQTAARRRGLAQSGNHAAATAFGHSFITVAPAAPSAAVGAPTSMSTLGIMMAGLAGLGFFALRLQQRRV